MASIEVVKGGIRIGDIIGGATQGSIFFAGIGGALAQDNANLFWNDTNNRLGIGTAVPTSTLHIKGSGTTSATSSLLVQNSAGTQLIKLTDDGRLTTGNVTIGTGGGESINDFSGNQAFSFFYNNTQIRNALSFGGGYLSGIIPLAGTTASFPAIKRASNNIEIKNADDTFGAGLSVGAALNTSAILQADSTTKGFLPPRMTTAQKNAISSPVEGLVVYDTDLNKLALYTTIWETVTSL